ncbi:MAG: serine/threonine protein kinase [Victivallales bacterium]|nr:serine/threonine protein kinase [Victivallales bacterium]
MEDLDRDFVLGGRYTIEKILGKCALGTAVYLAKEVPGGDEVLVRILPSSLVPDEEMTARFLQGAELAKKLRHRNILPVLDAGESDGLKYIVTGYEKGYLLEEYLEHRGSLDEKESIKLLKSLAEALDYAWREQRIVHRNICPDAILIAKGNVPMLTDFDLAKSLVHDNKLTLEGFAIGDPVYMSPEQARGEDLDFRSDMYCLGIVFYQLLCGAPPFSSGSRMEILQNQVSARHPAIQTRNKDVSQECSSVLDKMLDKDASRRYESFGKLVGDLEALLQGRQPSSLQKVKAVSSGARSYKMQAITMSAVKAPVTEPRPESALRCGEGVSVAKDSAEAQGVPAQRSTGKEESAEASGSGKKLFITLAFAALCFIGVVLFVMRSQGAKQPADIVEAAPIDVEQVVVKEPPADKTAAVVPPAVPEPVEEPAVEPAVVEPLEAKPVVPDTVVEPDTLAVDPEVTEKHKRACMNNIKQISVALQMYANVFQGKYPEKDGAEGLDMLRARGFLEVPQVFVSPASGRLASEPGKPISDDTCDYIYKGGYSEFSEGDLPMLWTKPDVHRDYGIVLYVNGEIKEYSGSNWLFHTRAGKK